MSRKMSRTPGVFKRLCKKCLCSFLAPILQGPELPFLTLASGRIEIVILGDPQPLFLEGTPISMGSETTT